MKTKKKATPKKTKKNKIKKPVKKKDKDIIYNIKESVDFINFPLVFDSVDKSFEYIYDLFKLNFTNCNSRPMIWKFQIYSLCENNRTYVDRQLNIMKSNKQIRYLKLGKNDSDFVCLMKESDYHDILQSCSNENKLLMDRFLIFIKEFGNLSICKSDIDGVFIDEEINKLIHLGVLKIRETNSWWLSCPFSGVFLSNFNLGEKTILSIINRSKYKQIVVNYTFIRKISNLSLPFGLSYYIYSLLGNKVITCNQTDSGLLIRLAK